MFCSLFVHGVLSEYQLVPDGVAQAQLAGELYLKQLKENNIGLDKVHICYSPFSRTIDTARVVAEVLSLPFDGPQCKVHTLTLTFIRLLFKIAQVLCLYHHVLHRLYMVCSLRERYFGPTFELKSNDKVAAVF